MEDVQVGGTRYASFLLRMWREGGQKGPLSSAAWQGEVEHLQTNRRWTFDNLEGLVGLLRQTAEDAGEPMRE